MKVALYDFNTKEREYLYGVLANSFEYDKEIKEAGAAVFYEHAIYPNTRTIISLNLFADAGVQHSEDDSRFYMNSGLTGTISYFISYRTRLFLNTGVTYTKNRYDFTRNYFLQPDILAVNTGAGLAINF